MNKKKYQKNSKKILVTGSNGFLGKCFSEYICKKCSAYQLYRVDIKGDKSQRHFYPCNLTRISTIKSILTKIKPNYIFHFAGGRVSDKSKLFDVNIKTTQNLLDAVLSIKNYNPRIIIPGSAAEYGKISKSVRRVTEKYVPQTNFEYGQIKLAQTQLALSYSDKGCHVCVARMFNILGSGVPRVLAIGKFADEIVRIERGDKEPIVQTRNLDGKRDFLDVMDVCAALFYVAQKGKSGEIYNVCSAKSYIIRDLLKKLIKYSNVQNIRINEERKAGSESFDVVGSNAKFKKLTSWRPKVTIEKSLKQTLEYYRNLENG